MSAYIPTEQVAALPEEEFINKALTGYVSPQDCIEQVSRRFGDYEALIDITQSATATAEEKKRAWALTDILFWAHTETNNATKPLPF